MEKKKEREEEEEGKKKVGNKKNIKALENTHFSGT